MSETDKEAMPDMIYALEAEHGAGAWVADVEDVVPSVVTHKFVPASERDALQARVAELEGVLGWYGEQARLARLIHSEGDIGRHSLQADGGKRARQALKGNQDD